MARREYTISQTSLDRKPSYSHNIRNHQIGRDINEFVISTLNPDTGNIQETLTLSGTHLPFQPVTTPVSQEILKFYYPGGQTKRTPTVQVLGSMEEDVVLTGRFKATKIQDVDRRNEPLIISDILKRFTEQGNVCLFQLGNWIKYGLIRQALPKYKTDADIDWEIRICVIGDKNPITGESLKEESNSIVRVFSSDEIEDTSALVDKITQQINENRQDTEKTYLPKISLTPFSIKSYLNKLREVEPIGEIVSVGEAVYDGYLFVIGTVDSVLDNLEEFSEIVEKTSFNIQKIALSIQSNISRLYKIQQDIFLAYNRVSSSFDAFTRLNAYNAIGNLFNLSNNLLLDLNNAQEAVRTEQFSSIQTVHITRANDTYQSISNKYYGTWERWEEIKNFNTGSDTLQGGEVLIIPT